MFTPVILPYDRPQVPGFHGLLFLFIRNLPEEPLAQQHRLPPVAATEGHTRRRNTHPRSRPNSGTLPQTEPRSIVGGLEFASGGGPNNLPHTAGGGIGKGLSPMNSRPSSKSKPEEPKDWPNKLKRRCTGLAASFRFFFRHLEYEYHTDNNICGPREGFRSGRLQQCHHVCSLTPSWLRRRATSDERINRSLESSSATIHWGIGVSRQFGLQINFAPAAGEAHTCQTANSRRC